VSGEGGADPRPFVLVNPGLEMIFLVRSEDGWEPELAKSFPAAGLQRVGEVAVDRPVSGFAASVSSGMVALRQLVLPLEVYTAGIDTAGIDTAFAQQAREKGGVLFGVTHLVNPATPVTTDQRNCETSWRCSKDASRLSLLPDTTPGIMDAIRAALPWQRRRS
jgi:hypothetical protein